jgi:hypothetical protein
VLQLCHTSSGRRLLPLLLLLLMLLLLLLRSTGGRVIAHRKPQRSLIVQRGYGYRAAMPASAARCRCCLAQGPP